MTRVPDSSDVLLDGIYQKRPDLEENSSLKMNIMGPHIFQDGTLNKAIMPAQSDRDDASELQNLEQHASSQDGNKVALKKEMIEEHNKQKWIVLNHRGKITFMENEIRYLKSILSSDVDAEKLAFISEILTSCFTRTPRVTSTGKTSSFYTEVLPEGKDSSPGVHHGSRMPSPNNVDSEGRLI